MKRLPVAGVLFALLACDFDPRADRLAHAARECTELYAAHDLRASAAGDDCLVLLVHAETRLSDTAVESIHYGTGDGAGYAGGLRQVLEDRGVRAVVYEDADRGLWTFGSITDDEAHSLKPCH